MSSVASAHGEPASSCTNATLYDRLADAFLGHCVRPFARFAPPADMRASRWYPHSNLQRHKGLARRLAFLVNGSYMIELGSFIGDSAIVWANALEDAGATDAVVICMDTWLGDVNMWWWKDRWLGPQGASGEPRLYEQFMANIAVEARVRSRVLPVRTSSSTGLRYAARLLAKRRLFEGRPRLIYLDAAHEYPETLHEMRLAWQLLPPGGFLVGDDFDSSWPGVQWSLNEFIAERRPSEMAPVDFACGWEGVAQPCSEANRTHRYPFVMTSAAVSAAGMVATKGSSSKESKGNQWVVRKALRTERQPGRRSSAERRAAGAASALARAKADARAASCLEVVEISGWHPRQVQPSRKGDSG